MRVLILLAVIILLLPALVCLQAGGGLSVLGGVACLLWLGLYFLALAGYKKNDQEDETP